jgi:hypothetical protein
MSPAASQNAEPRKPSQTSPPADIIEISGEGRRRLAEMADALVGEPEAKDFGTGSEPVAPVDTDRPDRLDEIRRRVARGDYGRPEVKRQIADRIADEMEQ